MGIYTETSNLGYEMFDLVTLVITEQIKLAGRGGGGGAGQW